MRKSIAIFLMCWLPLFMQSAWAMSTHMAFDNANLTHHDHLQYKHSQQHCEDQEAQQHQSQHPTQQHTCAHCVMCSVANASANMSGSLIASLHDTATIAPQYVEAIYNSATLPSAYKPPILA